MTILTVAAIGYGLMLGIAEYYVLRALIRFAVAHRPILSDEDTPQPAASEDTLRIRLRLAALLLIFFAFAMAAVYLFTDYLVPTAIGMLLGLVGAVAVHLILWLRRHR